MSCHSFTGFELVIVYWTKANCYIAYIQLKNHWLHSYDNNGNMWCIAQLKRFIFINGSFVFNVELFDLIYKDSLVFLLNLDLRFPFKIVTWFNQTYACFLFCTCCKGCEFLSLLLRSVILFEIHLPFSLV